ncbi:MULTISPECIES: sialate O-acetylesterase [unclassified Lentimonas]|uniref:sialate O-acetylesterase n=2 Tax=Lentimonas TaxID=417293 RepID=UPI001321E66C|nr:MULTISPECIES: sialate O-acetylesterase [unclassified Lentimonas]CAA6696520.1 Unannotated [Lentimonas sp. CC19]CAA6696671.1 Unannotated [Lentimonas sp. CC10]CAA7072447.1 Unannotated [Lentimonas sp. CC11]
MKYMRYILTAALCALSPTASVIASADQPVHVVLFAGQSNMAGAGNYHALSSEDKARVEDAAKQVSLTYNGKSTAPLTYFTYSTEKYDFSDRFGPELFVGIELAQANQDQEYLFIKRAQGGTALYGAWNPEWSADKSKAVEKGDRKQNLHLVDEHIAYIHQELTRLEAAGQSYKIIGLLWMQGENDAAKEISARSYEANLKQLIARYRREFNLPDMPFIYGQINSRYGNFEPGPTMVRQAMVDVANADSRAHVTLTTANPPWDDFPKHTDQVHYNEVGQKRLGTAFAKSLIELNQP